MKRILLIGLISSLTLGQTIKIACDHGLKYPLKKVAELFTKQTDIDVEIVSNNGEALFNKIKNKNSEGFDLFIPANFRLILNNKTFFKSQKLIGYNKPVIIVRKNNPKNIKTLDDFKKNDVIVVLAKPNTSYIGKISREILIKYKDSSFAEKIYQKAIQVPTENEINKNIKNKIADTSINWRSSVFQNDNNKYLSIINIPYIASKQKLIMAELKEAPHHLETKKFLNFITKPKNKLILKKLGFK